MGAIHRRNNIKDRRISVKLPETRRLNSLTLPITGERTDFDPAWSPDSKTLAFFSSAGERGQRQLWTVKSDGSDAEENYEPKWICSAAALVA